MYKWNRLNAGILGPGEECGPMRCDHREGRTTMFRAQKTKLKRLQFSTWFQRIDPPRLGRLFRTGVIEILARSFDRASVFSSPARKIHPTKLLPFKQDTLQPTQLSAPYDRIWADLHLPPGYYLPLGRCTTARNPPSRDCSRFSEPPYSAARSATIARPNPVPGLDSSRRLPRFSASAA